MVSIEAVRATNSGLKDQLSPGLVAVFVGGTSGIGESTARELVRYTVKPRIYLVGRNETEASRIITELQKLNPDGKISFVKTEASLLRSVDEACDEIKAKEEKINLLFMTAGMLSMSGRQETSEGLDKKFSLHYYSRMRFISNLLPQLTAAGCSSTNPLARVISVLAAGDEGQLELDDLSLKTHFSDMKCATHTVTMNTLAVEQLASAHPDVSFIHAYPGIVKTNIARELGGMWRVAVGAATFLLTPFTTPLKESGERHLFLATSAKFPARNAAVKEDASVGGDGAKGSGWYNVGSTGAHRLNEKVVDRYRTEGVGKRVWEHTLSVFEKICGSEAGRY